MTKNQIIRTVAFLLVVFTLLLALCDLFEYENSHISKRIETYQHLEKNTVDAVAASLILEGYLAFRSR